MRDWRVYLDDMLAAIGSIGDFVAGMEFDDFVGDDKTCSAVIRKLEVIGEAAKQIPVEIRDAAPRVPWKEMAGMRDRLIHAYFGVDHLLVWRTVKKRLPAVEAELVRILREKE